MKKILIVDDGILNRLLIKTIINKNSQEDFDIIEAVDGLDAVDKCKNIEFDLIFMDFKMPKMNGNDATLMIKDNTPNIKVVSITSAITEIKNPEIFDDFLIKPFNIDGIINIIKKLIKFP